KSYWLHRVASGSPAAIHLTSGGRSEIVIYGEGVKFRGQVPPLPVGGEFTVSVPADLTFARVTRVVKVNGDAEVKEARCAPDLAKPPLNRDPGRLFGQKRTPDTPILDGSVVPAGGQ